MLVTTHYIYPNSVRNPDIGSNSELVEVQNVPLKYYSHDTRAAYFYGFRLGDVQTLEKYTLDQGYDVCVGETISGEIETFPKP